MPKSGYSVKEGVGVGKARLLYIYINIESIRKWEATTIICHFFSVYCTLGSFLFLNIHSNLANVLIHLVNVQIHLVNVLIHLVNVLVHLVNVLIHLVNDLVHLLNVLVNLLNVLVHMLRECAHYANSAISYTFDQHFISLTFTQPTPSHFTRLTPPSTWILMIFYNDNEFAYFLIFKIRMFICCQWRYCTLYLR